MPIKHRSCYKCKTEIETAEAKCARCGRRLRSRTEIRTLGALMIFLGSFLIIFMGYISLWMYNVILHPETANGAKFTGDNNELLLIAAVFGFVFLFSLVAVINGFWQLIFGRRNMILVWIIIVFGIIFIGSGLALTLFT